MILHTTKIFPNIARNWCRLFYNSEKISKVNIFNMKMGLISNQNIDPIRTTSMYWYVMTLCHHLELANLTFFQLVSLHLRKFSQALIFYVFCCKLTTKNLPYQDSNFNGLNVLISEKKNKNKNKKNKIKWTI